MGNFTGGIGQAAAGAAQAAAAITTTKLQLDAQKKAREIAQSTANSVAPTYTTAADYANGLLTPYTTAGNNAANLLSNGMSEQQLEQTPGYQFNLNQGEQAVTNSAAQRGLADSGAAEKAASKYASGLADSTYQNQFNNEMSLMNQGQNAINQQGQNITNAANEAGQTRMEGANAAMTTIANQGNIYNNGLTNVGKAVGGIATAFNYGDDNSANNEYDKLF